MMAFLSRVVQKYFNPRNAPVVHVGSIEGSPERIPGVTGAQMRQLHKEFREKAFAEAQRRSDLARSSGP